jgi:hypothetical protein
MYAFTSLSCFCVGFKLETIAVILKTNLNPIIVQIVFTLKRNGGFFPRVLKSFVFEKLLIKIKKLKVTKTFFTSVTTNEYCYYIYLYISLSPLRVLLIV